MGFYFVLVLEFCVQSMFTEGELVFYCRSTGEEVAATVVGLRFFASYCKWMWHPNVRTMHPVLCFIGAIVLLPKYSVQRSLRVTIRAICHVLCLLPWLLLSIPYSFIYFSLQYDFVDCFQILASSWCLLCILDIMSIFVHFCVFWQKFPVVVKTRTFLLFFDICWWKSTFFSVLFCFFVYFSVFSALQQA